VLRCYKVGGPDPRKGKRSILKRLITGGETLRGLSCNWKMGKGEQKASLAKGNWLEGDSKKRTSAPREGKVCTFCKKRGKKRQGSSKKKHIEFGAGMKEEGQRGQVQTGGGGTGRGGVTWGKTEENRKQRLNRGKKLIRQSGLLIQKVC